MPSFGRLSAGAFFLAVLLTLPYQASASTSPNIPALVDKYAARHEIPLHIARNLVRVESGGRQSAVSRTGARGVMQLTPATARALGVDINDPEQNIEGGMRYLRLQYARFGRWDLALAAYHAGPHAVIKYNGVPPKSQAYVTRVLGSAKSTSPAKSQPQQAPLEGQRDETPQLDGGPLWPVRGVVTAGFGQHGRRFHSGVDISAPQGTPIRAARAGRVILSDWHYDYGRTVILDHGNGVSTLYGHASRLLVNPGKSVQAGQVIALVGCTGRCTGPHVHFEVRVNGRAVDPLGPDASAAVRLPARGSSVETTITTVTDTLRDGQVVRRVEETLFVHGQLRIRILREFRLVNGVLKLVKERTRVRIVDGEDDDEDEDEDEDDDDDEDDDED